MEHVREGKHGAIDMFLRHPNYPMSKATRHQAWAFCSPMTKFSGGRSLASQLIA
jgi:hypothetical protein